MSINKVIITGNLTRDPELRSTPSGTSVLNFGVAVNDRRRTADGNWEDYPNYIDCTMFGRRAEGVQQYLHKGLKVAIEGRLHYSSWEDRNTGQKRSKIDVTVDELEFMASRNDAGARNANYNASQGGSYGGGQNAGQGAGGYDAGMQQGAASYDGGMQQGGMQQGGMQQGGMQQGGGNYSAGGQNAATTYGSGQGNGAYNADYGAGNTGAGNAGNYNDASAQRPQEAGMPEPPTPNAYDDEDIPF